MSSFDHAVKEADYAYEKDKDNDEISAIRDVVRMASEAHNKGNNHYEKGAYLQAYKEYEAGLQYAKYNVTLLSYMNACKLQLERWEDCIEICSDVLRIKPDDKNALYGRAHSYGKVTNCYFSIFLVVLANNTLEITKCKFVISCEN
jgi:tetratricopeptide (TPR) repeat protein